MAAKDGYGRLVTEVQKNGSSIAVEEPAHFKQTAACLPPIVQLALPGLPAAAGLVLLP